MATTTDDILVVYRLRSKVTGLYSRGGTSPIFDKKGKIWRNIGHVKNHLNQLNAYHRDRYKQLDVELQELEFSVSENCISTTSYEDFCAIIAQNKLEKQADRQRRHQAWKEEQERAAYQKLHQKYGDHNGK